MDRSPVVVSAQSFVENLFLHTDRHRQGRAHRRFVRQMLEGILAQRSVLVANVARWLDEERPLVLTEQRLCNGLGEAEIPWDELRERAVELACRCVKKDDLIAFDPGDLSKRYAEKMENLHPVHDGSTGKIRLGYEDFSVEAIRWKEGEKQQIPLFHRLTNARCEDYRSQNTQIVRAIEEIYEHLGDARGIWLFDRGHDRRRIFEKLLKLSLRWIVRVFQNREVLVLRNGQWVPSLLIDEVKAFELHDAGMQLQFPKVTHSKMRLGFFRVRLPWDKENRELTCVVAHDPRNRDPVAMLTSLPVATDEDALLVFGYYLERWGKEEGYRFTKSWLNTEAVRVLNWEGIQNLVWLAHMVHLWVALTYRNSPVAIERQCERELKNFRSIENVRYRYYRVAHWMRTQLMEQNRVSAAMLATTEVA